MILPGMQVIITVTAAIPFPEPLTIYIALIAV